MKAWKETVGSELHKYVSQSQSQRDITADALSQWQPHQCGCSAGSHCRPFFSGLWQQVWLHIWCFRRMKRENEKNEKRWTKVWTPSLRWEDRSSLVYSTIATWQNRERKQRRGEGGGVRVAREKEKRRSSPCLWQALSCPLTTGHAVWVRSELSS